MNLEKELCQKVYAHHGVLKGELSNEIINVLKKHNLPREVWVEVVNQVNATVDQGSNKMVTDFQRTFKQTK